MPQRGPSPGPTWEALPEDASSTNASEDELDGDMIPVGPGPELGSVLKRKGQDHENDSSSNLPKRQRLRSHPHQAHARKRTEPFRLESAMLFRDALSLADVTGPSSSLSRRSNLSTPDQLDETLLPRQRLTARKTMEPRSTISSKFSTSEKISRPLRESGSSATPKRTAEVGAVRRRTARKSGSSSHHSKNYSALSEGVSRLNNHYDSIRSASALLLKSSAASSSSLSTALSSITRRHGAVDSNVSTSGPHSYSPSSDDSLPPAPLAWTPKRDRIQDPPTVTESLEISAVDKGKAIEGRSKSCRTGQPSSFFSRSSAQRKKITTSLRPAHANSSADSMRTDRNSAKTRDSADHDVIEISSDEETNRPTAPNVNNSLNPIEIADSDEEEVPVAPSHDIETMQSILQRETSNNSNLGVTLSPASSPIIPSYLGAAMENMSLSNSGSGVAPMEAIEESEPTPHTPKQPSFPLPQSPLANNPVDGEDSMHSSTTSSSVPMEDPVDMVVHREDTLDMTVAQGPDSERSKSTSHSPDPLDRSKDIETSLTIDVQPVTSHKPTFASSSLLTTPPPSTPKSPPLVTPSANNAVLTNETISNAHFLLDTFPSDAIETPVPDMRGLKDALGVHIPFPRKKTKDSKSKGKVVTHSNVERQTLADAIIKATKHNRPKPARNPPDFSKFIDLTVDNEDDNSSLPTGAEEPANKTLSLQNDFFQPGESANSTLLPSTHGNVVQKKTSNEPSTGSSLEPYPESDKINDSLSARQGGMVHRANEGRESRIVDLRRHSTPTLSPAHKRSRTSLPFSQMIRKLHDLPMSFSSSNPNQASPQSTEQQDKSNLISRNFPFPVSTSIISSPASCANISTTFSSENKQSYTPIASSSNQLNAEISSSDIFTSPIVQSTSSPSIKASIAHIEHSDFQTETSTTSGHNLNETSNQVSHEDSQVASDEPASNAMVSSDDDPMTLMEVEECQALVDHDMAHDTDSETHKSFLASRDSISPERRLEDFDPTLDTLDEAPSPPPGSDSEGQMSSCGADISSLRRSSRNTSQSSIEDSVDPDLSQKMMELDPYSEIPPYSPSRSPSPDDSLVPDNPTYGGLPALTWKSFRKNPDNFTQLCFYAKDIPHALQDQFNNMSERMRLHSKLRMIFKAVTLENTADDEPEAPPIDILNDVDDEPTPPWEFHYSNKMWHGEGVPPPNMTNLTNCNCVGRCDPKSKTCACVQKQREHTDTNDAQRGFAYNLRGQLTIQGYPIFECNDLCGCDEDCRNRVVQHGRKVSVNVAKTPTKGWGVFAGKKIPKGSFIGIYAGELLTDAVGEQRGMKYDKSGRTYLFDLDFHHLKLNDKNWETKYVVDAYHCGNFTRFLNHSCDPNSRLFPCYINEGNIEKPLLTIFAIKDIEENDEVCFNYAGNYPDDDGDDQSDAESDEWHLRNEAIHAKCLCGTKRCTGIMFK